jgi:hypothetical protein
MFLQPRTGHEAHRLRFSECAWRGERTAPDPAAPRIAGGDPGRSPEPRQRTPRIASSGVGPWQGSFERADGRWSSRRAQKWHWRPGRLPSHTPPVSRWRFTSPGAPNAKAPMFSALTLAVALVMNASISSGSTQNRGPQDSNLVPPPPALDDGRHDFDFLHGSWRIHNRRLRQPLTGSTEWYEFEGSSIERPLWAAWPTSRSITPSFRTAAPFGDWPSGFMTRRPDGGPSTARMP